MKSIGFTLMVLFLLGAGCATSEPTTLQVPAPNAPETPEMEVQDTTLKTDLEILPEGGAAGEVAPVQINMRAGNFFFEPSRITVEAGHEVVVTFTENTGFHTFAIDAIRIDEPIEAGLTVGFTAPSEPGEYEFYCSIGDHRARGMTGVLVVE